MKLLMLIVTLVFVSCGMEYSNGARVGVVTKFSKKGFFCKTWAGEMKTGFMTTQKTEHSTSIIPETFYFSIESEDVATDIKTAMELGKKVELQYSQKAFQAPCNGSDYKITKVNVL